MGQTLGEYTKQLTLTLTYTNIVQIQSTILYKHITYKSKCGTKLEYQQETNTGIGTAYTFYMPRESNPGHEVNHHAAIKRSHPLKFGYT